MLASELFACKLSGFPGLSHVPLQATRTQNQSIYSLKERRSIGLSVRSLSRNPCLEDDCLPELRRRSTSGVQSTTELVRS